jgi:predicted Rdx family selenoprotein
MAARLCMMCNEPLNGAGDCDTAGCIYNPVEDTKTHDAEFEYVEGKGDTGPEDDDSIDWGALGLTDEEREALEDDEAEDLPDDVREDLENEGKGEREQPKGDPINEDELSQEEREKMRDDQLDQKINQDADDADDRMGKPDGEPEAEDESGGDEGDMDTSEVEAEGEDKTHAENDAEDEKGQLDTTEDLPEQKKETQLSDDEDGPEPQDDAHDKPESFEDEDDDLPPRPQGCDGNCKPSDDPGSEDGEPCPHCTAKAFREQMKEEGKEQQPEEQMESDWQKFLDDWQEEAEKNDSLNEGEENDGPDAESESEPDDEQISEDGDGGQGDPEDQPEDWEPDPENLDDDDDLPPRPQGCSGNCAENEDPDGDGEPCPHCTAKRFKEAMKEEQEQGGLPDAEDLAELFQQMLQQQREQMQGEQEPEPEPKEEPEEPEDSEDPPEDELKDEEPEQDEPEQKEKPKREEFKRLADDLTIAQEKRFDNLVGRLQKKVNGTFGNTAEEVTVLPKTEGQFQGEDISQAIQIRSRGVVYWVTLSAAKDIED